MKTISEQISNAFKAAIAAAFSPTLDGIDIDPLVSPSANEKFGDYQSNAAMGLAKTLAEKAGEKTNPRAVAEQIIAKLNVGGMSDTPPDKSWIAGPGFINVKLSPKWLAEQLSLAGKTDRLGVEPVAKPQTVVIDYSGPNIAKELHVGHLRSTILGDAATRVLTFQGHKVIRQNHVGDWGTQFGMLIANLQDKQSAGGETKLSDLEAFYVEAKKRFDVEVPFQERARLNVVKLQSGDADALAMWRMLVDKTREHYLPIYRRLGVLLTPDDERGESFYNTRLAAVVEELKSRQIAVESEGATAVFVEGFKTPLIIEKSGGGFLYGTTDLAAAKYRITELKADRVVYFVDARQSQHFAQVFATVKKAGWGDNVSMEHAAFGTMLGPDGTPFKTKTGGTVKLKDLLDEAEQRAFDLAKQKAAEREESPTDEQLKAIAHTVGIGGVKYSDLSKDRVSDYVFSFDAMLAMDGNTAPYMQYAYARVRSIFRRAAERGITFGDGATTTIALDAPQELALAKQILRFGEVVEQVGRELKPHVLCAYLYDLAGRYSSFYEACPVLTSEEPMRSSRLALANLTAKVLAKGLDLLGIEHPDQM
ncbi:arginine--tRNA ligase [Humisphaera borealis]|uniref:Arginine--tRNA ligase n=1 Tax=Humisphaera borealis TaxID=2807512 RepID=A0A7M2WSI2_9BACT|nr:arginine--tRNA ligase [Humisphaera borealis]QOV88142.1 arginine--tRNA ligase [Humisphaera borealis]